MSNQSKDLLKIFNQHLDELKTSVESFPWENKQAYAAWLAQSYYYVRHTTIFLSLMAGKYGIASPEGHKETLSHLREEHGHDKLALNDLKALGVDVQAFPEQPPTTLLYQTQYYWLHCFGPATLTGYSLMLEGLSARYAPDVAKRVEKAHGTKTASFLKVHGVADQHHFAEGVERLALAPKIEIENALKNLAQSTELYRSLLNAAASFAKVTPLKKAA